MMILAGLGNYEPKYLRNRHNVGFMALDVIAHAWSAGPWRKRFQSQACELVIGSQKLLLLKPQTFYNNSGHAVGEAANFYRVPPENVVVFHDELDLAPGKFRMKTGGGAAGNNGIKSITAQIGPDFRRARIGIGHPGDKGRVTGYVLSDFAKSEEDWLIDLLDAIADSLDLLARGEFDAFQTRVTHKAPAPEPAKRGRPDEV
ncbi:MAG: aminoacyl-tRNA hydrolase [Oceanicaulis sp.]|uniref:Peptidyl-tRNA hydrolase n=1 Tax=Maricaulis virginensis TaxID=144022 RepID=A0A9W6ILN9_9PROT|nr:aminoacyl-tRNA hydrolase [Maricaulis virginensis]MBI74462.1 aminoacyl-tRNA hydrolase [Oceanicaulis sp.]GLK51360.1 peptidyl-tRNA hydrolase [Maricaulis virginensis]|tara:strand:- start:1302 stop:1907 length:606 start_codon:yes stop_codon:yes gene_type:complete